MDINQFAEAFFVEAAELLGQAEQLLLTLDTGAPDPEQLNAIFRAAHSIKGGAATFGFQAVTETTHILENLLGRVRDGDLALSTPMVDAFLQAKDSLTQQLAAYRAGQTPDEAQVAAICEVLRDLGMTIKGGDSAPAPVSASRVLKIRFSGLKDSEWSLLLSELGNLGTVLTSEQEPGGGIAIVESACASEDVVAVCCFVIDESQIDVATVPAPEMSQMLAQTETSSRAQATKLGGPTAAGLAAPKETSIRVDVEKVDKLINLVGELVITQAMLAEAAALLDPVLYDRLLSGLGHLERNATDLQESVMSIRMVPMDSVFSRYPRVIRDVSSKLGKQVRLETYGKETELDKGLVERIIDPLTHLVRNSLDHGIEMPDQRAAAGKDPTGELLLSAQHHGGNIVIEVTDDGAGLNREKILAKARQQGLPVSDAMPDEEVWQLIFAPGFSTAEVVTDISGRGVGMDVVRRNIQDMGGRVEVSSRSGRGTTTRIVLPLTLAILNGMSVKVGQEVYVLPLNNVIESLQASAEQLHSIAGDSNVIRVRGEYLPLIALHQLFAVPGAKSDPRDGILVIVQSANLRYALLVDELVGQHQVVVKNLEDNYRRIPGISAATILGDGSVALIVDVAGVPRVSRAYAATVVALADASRRDVTVSGPG